MCKWGSSIDTLLSGKGAESRNVGRIAERTVERLVAGKRRGHTGKREGEKRKRGRRRRGVAGEREKWRPRAEITFVFLI